ncbi:MAG: carbohydrate-binding protein [Bacteroides sp.]|nr:carbohydrate-binding protein [Bacteroides sp.]
MNMLKRYWLLLLLLLGMVSCKKENNREVWSEWQLQNRADNTYLYEDEGVCKSGEYPVNDSYIWVIEEADEYVKIRNKRTGRYLHFNQQRSSADMIETDTDDPTIQWQYGGYDWDNMENYGWYNIHNRVDPEKFLLSNQGLQVAPTDVNKDFASHWTFIRSAGSRSPFMITGNCVKEASFLGMWEACYVSDDEITSNYHREGESWKRELDISRFPQLKAENHPLLVALYRMSLEEMQLDIRKQDTTFQAGALWPDTWTRDAVYAIHLAYGLLLPEVSKKTLEKQTLTHPREALQDTGSGGSWPISTDRVVWAIAAWEYYLMTGDTQWLEFCYEGLSYTAEKDIHVAFDEQVNLFRGETCSMDWRTHTYPNWYTNVNIGESYSSGTNVLHAFMYDFLAYAGKHLHKPQEEAERWASYAAKVKEGINKHFWMADKGYYSAYMHPEMENYLISQRGGCMSNGLSIVFGVTDEAKAKEITSRFPLYPYGAPTLYPSIPDDFAYHNKGIWPVWESYFMLGAHKTGNIEATAHIMNSLVRQAALFLTNKENMTYDTGYDRNTALNSDRQLWSVAAYLGMFYKVIFGMELVPEGISFRPAVPEGFFGPFELQGFKFRQAELDILIKGSGNIITSVLLDGNKQ